MGRVQAGGASGRCRVPALTRKNHCLDRLPLFTHSASAPSAGSVMLAPCKCVKQCNQLSTHSSGESRSTVPPRPMARRFSRGCAVRAAAQAALPTRQRKRWSSAKPQLTNSTVATGTVALYSDVAGFSRLRWRPLLCAAILKVDSHLITSRLALFLKERRALYVVPVHIWGQTHSLMQLAQNCSGIGAQKAAAQSRT